MRPFAFRDASAFHPGTGGAGLARIHGILGRMPMYLRLWRADRSVAENLSALCTDPGSPLLNEGELLLRTDEVTRVGGWWTKDGQTEIDVVGLRGREPVVVGEAKWSRSVDRRVLHALIEKRSDAYRGRPPSDLTPL